MITIVKCFYGDVNGKLITMLWRTHQKSDSTENYVTIVAYLKRIGLCARKLYLGSFIFIYIMAFLFHFLELYFQIILFQRYTKCLNFLHEYCLTRRK